MQQGKSCSPSDAKPSTHISPQITKVAISIRLGMDQGQPWKPLWTTLRQAEDSSTSRCTVVANKTVKQDASVQLPTSHVLPYATLEETAMQNSLMTAFESSSRFCVSCCNFQFCSSYEFTQSCWNTGLIATSELISAYFSRVPLKHIYHHFIHPPPVHKVTMNTIKTQLYICFFS